MAEGYVQNLCDEWEWMVVGMDSPKLSNQGYETTSKISAEYKRKGLEGGKPWGIDIVQNVIGIYQRPSLIKKPRVRMDCNPIVGVVKKPIRSLIIGVIQRPL
jgi:hypothetical protein